MLKSFFSAEMSLNTAQSFATTRKTVIKKAASKPKRGFFCIVVKFFNSTANKDCFSQLIFIHDLERVNEFLRLNSHVKFSSNEEVA